MKLFTKEIDQKLFAQYSKGSDLSNQMVVAKIFNPYGRGTWYLINSDEDDPDYLWAIVDLFEVEVGSVSRKELESIKIKPFNFGLERDLSFTPRNAEEVFKGLLSGKTYAKGGKLKYDPTRDVVAIVIKDNNFNMMFKKGDFLGGAYQMEKGGSLENYTYVSPRKIIFARLKSGEDIKPINGFYIRKDASGTLIFGDEAKPNFKPRIKSLKISIPRPILLTGSPSKSPQMMKFIGTFSGKDLLRPAMTFVQIKEGSIVATDAHKLVRIIDGSTLNEDKLVCEAAKCKTQSEDQKFPSVSHVTNSIDSEFSESYDMVDLYESLMQVRNDDLKNKLSRTLRVIELKLENQTIYFNITLLLECVKGCLLLGWKKAFISYSQGRKAIVFTEEKAEGRVGEVSLILLMPIFSDSATEKVTITPKMILEQGGMMADGGEVFIPTTYLDYNPDYLVGTNTMYEMFEKGGGIGFEGLSKKVAARYVGKSVKPKFQAEYGKTYSSEEASEVGDKVAAKVYRQQQQKMADGGFVAIYNGKKINIEADSLYAAKLKAIQEFKVPKSKQGLLSVVSNKSLANQDFRFMARGGFVSKGELVWRKLSRSTKMKFLIDNFTPQITPRSQEILVNKDFNFLPKNVKILLESKYANVEDYADGGSTYQGTRETTDVAEAIFYYNSKKGKIETSFGDKTLQGLTAMIENDNYSPTEIANAIFYVNDTNNRIETGYGTKSWNGLLDMIERARQGFANSGGIGKMAKGGVTTNSMFTPYNYVYYNSTDYNYPYMLVIGNLAWGISDEFGPNFLGNIQREFFKSTQDFANNHGYRVLESRLPENVAEWVKEIRSKEYETLRGKRYKINPNEYPATFAKGGRLLTTRERYIQELKGLATSLFEGLDEGDKFYNVDFLKIPGVSIEHRFDEPEYRDDIDYSDYPIHIRFLINQFIRDYNLSDDEILNAVIGLGRKQISIEDFLVAIDDRFDGSQKKELLDFIKSDEALRESDGDYLAKGGKISEFDDVFIISKNKLGMVEAIADNIYYITTPFGESFEAALDDLQKVKSFSKGGAMEHMILLGDKVLDIYKNVLIVQSVSGGVTVIDFRQEPIARRILVERITGKNTLASAKEFIDTDPSFKTSTMAMGGSLQGHGLEVGDLIVEDLGGYIRVVSEDGKDFFITLRTGDRETEAPLPFKHGGKVKNSDVTRLATKTNEAGDEVVDLTEFYEGGGNVPKVFDVPAQFLDAEGKRKNDKKTIKELTDFVLGLPQTKSIYYNDNLGGYTPSRKKLHAEIINKFKKEVVCINNDKPIAIFMGGSPASGKSSFLRKYSPFLLKEEILKIDADEIRAMLPEYEGWNAAQTHLETRDIVNTLLSNKNIGIPCDFDIIYDGTMNSVKSYIPLMDILRKRGYKIFIVFMDNVPKDVIIKRALDRYKSSGRFVPLEVIEDFFTKGKSAFNELKKDVDGYMRIDGSSQDYKVLEEGGMKLPRDREYSKLGTKIKASDIPISYKKGGLSLLY